MHIITEILGDESLQLSINMTGYDSIKYHTLRITVRVEFRGAVATLPYYFKFKKEELTEESE